MDKVLCVAEESVFYCYWEAQSVDSYCPSVQRFARSVIFLYWFFLSRSSICDREILRYSTVIVFMFIWSFTFKTLFYESYAPIFWGVCIYNCYPVKLFLDQYIITCSSDDTSHLNSILCENVTATPTHSLILSLWVFFY